MQVEGVIHLISEAQSFGSNGFQKRELVIKTNEQYVQMINIEFHQDKCDLLNNYSVGQDVKVSINLRGREWINPQGEAKYFNSIVGWRIENLGQVNNHQQSPPPEQFEPVSSISDEEPDDLPF